MRSFKIIILLVVLSSLVWVFFCVLTLPSLKGIGNKTRVPSVTVFNEQKKIVGSIGDVYGGEILQIKDLPSHLIDSILILEDKNFYSHYGIDFKALIRAIIINLKEMSYVQGGSTITQQLSKVIFLDTKKNLSRKFKELIISFYLEYKFTKNEILLMYVNRVYLGSGVYGVEAAAKRYFSKSVRSLTIADSAILAGLLKAPSKLSPLSNINASVKRGKLVIELLYKEKKISKEEYNSAKKKLIDLKQNKNYRSFSPRYYIDWIYSTTPDEILNSKKDLHIYSTLNSKLQRNVNNVIKNKRKDINHNIQTAVVIMDYDGAVKAIIGGKSWHESKFNRATQSKRQLGSIFKTYVYLTALSVGYDINDYVLDEPIISDDWKPKNFASKYRGKITLKEAFAISSNVAAIRIAEEIGRKSIIDMTKKLGIISYIPDEPSMALGVASMSLLEVVGSFAAICGSGRPIIPFGIREIRHRDSVNIWKRNKPSRKKVIDEPALSKIKVLLEEVIKNGTGKRLSKMPVTIIGKTGTSQKNRDAWFIGCTKNYIIGVWAGRDDDKSMSNVFGSTLPLQIFKDIVDNL